MLQGWSAPLHSWSRVTRAFVFNMAADLLYEGCNFLRQRLVLATLSGKSVKIKNIRALDDDPGLKGTVSLDQTGLWITNINFIFCNISHYLLIIS